MVGNTNSLVFNVLRVSELEEGMRISVHRDVGNLYGTIKEIIEERNDYKSIVLKDISTCPEDVSIPNGTTLIQFTYQLDKEVMVLVS